MPNNFCDNVLHMHIKEMKLPNVRSLSRYYTASFSAFCESTFYSDIIYIVVCHFNNDYFIQTIQ